jgi:hypothetical protein
VVTVGVGFLFILVVLSGFATAAPFLVCDPYGPDGLQPTAFEVTVDGRTERVGPLTYPDGSVYLRYDLQDLPDGEHVLGVKALNDVLRTESVEEQSRVEKKDGVFSLAAKAKEKMPPSRAYKGYIR